MPKIPKSRNIKKELQVQTNAFLNGCGLKANSSPILEKVSSPPESQKPKPSEPLPSSSSSSSVVLSKLQSQKKCELLRLQILEIEKQIEEMKVAQNGNNIDDKNSMEDEENLGDENFLNENVVNENKENDGIEMNTQSQLYGKNFQEEMVLLSNNIYCKRDIYDMAVCNSIKGTHVVRRLIEGVYKRDAIKQYTISGKSNEIGKKCGCLDRCAKEAICDFSSKLCQKYGWPSPDTFQLNRAMSQKISELKRMYKKL